MLKVEKKVIGNLTKCYSLTEVVDEGKPYVICAAEKEDPCYMFDLEGNQVAKLWDGPGGVMTLQQFPSDEFTLMATWKFYGPNNSAEAKIVYYTKEDGELKCHTLCDLPFVHRFGIVERNGQKYIVACTLKSAHAFKDDWTCPGRIWVGVLPEDITQYNQDNQLPLTALVSGLYRNHGFTTITEDGCTYAVVGSDNGVHVVVPPETPDGEWGVEQIYDEPTSDMLYVDFDGDGEKELLIMAPFHGEKLYILKKKDGVWEKVYTHPVDLPFLHAIYACKLDGKDYAIVGNRQGERELFAIHYCPKKEAYVVETLDQGAGPANVMYFNNNGQDKLIAANRETDEIAMYTLTKE